MKHIVLSIIIISTLIVSGVALGIYFEPDLSALPAKGVVNPVYAQASANLMSGAFDTLTSIGIGLLAAVGIALRDFLSTKRSISNSGVWLVSSLLGLVINVVYFGILGRREIATLMSVEAFSPEAVVVFARVQLISLAIAVTVSLVLVLLRLTHTRSSGREETKWQSGFLARRSGEVAPNTVVK